MILALYFVALRAGRGVRTTLDIALATVVFIVALRRALSAPRSGVAVAPAPVAVGNSQIHIVVHRTA